ncbi:type I-F CRISPR-associated protein Csy1 [Curvibacter sp. HBC61]|uniref:Type I-F CRISPR-associated protein Csy1 n=1 Tax=Curvibacter cyanobacteriorum TaxID=3026422 RepID=A0ABT5N1L1_9BURK|nr:type I-F CRISPR-associated protein Csy1 [Curvibacter sp. HBC61]MDD0840195.1 type I-F CRISPR-associated protein Csy1 [Curvibacter sp. HBC61]
MSASEPRAHALRALISDFLIERLSGKLEKLPSEDPKRTELQAQFQPAVWLEDAARRVQQIQAVTHSLKPIHPDAKGSSLYRPPKALLEGDWVGSHCLGESFDSDVVGNAAALDVYKFLKLSHEGQSLLDLSVSGDADLVAAFSEDETLGREWAAAFAGLAAGRSKLSSHTNAKQLYWLLDDETRSAHDDGAYHLLAPLYPTSLVHRVYQQLQDDRFSDEAKAARAARKEGSYHPRPVREYPDLAIQKLGGTKPQNISQLNSERRGDNCLLASVPPVWKSAAVRPLWGVRSLFEVWGRRPSVQQPTRQLRRFLEGQPPANEVTRRRVRDTVEALVDELIQFQAELLGLEPGWTQSSECELPAAQRAWLDPEDFTPVSGIEPDAGDAVAADFARWLNAQLRSLLPVGDDEFAVWRKLAREALRAVEREQA